MTHRTLDVHWLPSLVEPGALAGATVVVIDVLRASTTIVHALEAGAREVIPCLEVDEARAVAAELPAAEVVLGGERQGLPIDGFDLGNSPAEYTPETVGGRTVVFTTSNGTRAMHRCRRAGRVLIGAFVNASAAVDRLAATANVHFLAAGSRGRRSRDDELLAGMLVGWLERFGRMPCRLTGRAATTRDQWAASTIGSLVPGRPANPELIARELADSIAGRRLASIGQQSDVLIASQLDRFHTVPELDLHDFRIQ